MRKLVGKAFVLVGALVVGSSCSSGGEPFGSPDCPGGVCAGAPGGGGQAGDPDDEGEEEGGTSADEDSDDPDDDPGTGGEETGGEPEDDPDDEPVPSHGLPCDVFDALAANCFMCHDEMPAFGAPMALADYTDHMVPAPSDAARPVHDVVAERLVDPIKPMPPGGGMDEAEVQVILDWIAAGAPEDPYADCGDTPEREPPTVGPEALPCEPDYTLTAHTAGGETGFHVPQQGADDLYQCFSFQAPFATPTQATAWAPIIDDERVVHHWILYRTTQPQQQNGVFPCDVSLQLSADFVAGWAPGGKNMVMPDGVGLELGKPGDWYVLQIHYNNSAQYDDAIDKSGVAFCQADAPRPDTAGVLSVGTVGLNIPAGAVAHQETGTCGWLGTLGWPDELHVLGGSPHMHQLGRAFRTEVIRQGGVTEMVTDVPIFNFEDQGMYLNEPEVILHPGETLRTTCTFDNPHPFNVGFGEGTNDEMCFNFMLVYPIQEINNRNCGIIF